MISLLVLVSELTFIRASSLEIILSSDMSFTFIMSISLCNCLVIFSTISSPPSTTTVNLERWSISLCPTAKLCILKPLLLNILVILFRTPGLSFTNAVTVLVGIMFFVSLMVIV